MRISRQGSRAIDLFDQGLSSLHNVLAVVLVARSLTAEQFGGFSLAYAVLILVLGVSRSYFGTRLSLTPDHAEAFRQTRAVMGSLMILGLPIALGVFVAGYFLSSGQVAIVAVVAVSAPLLCAQDAVRFGSVACGRASVAMYSDLIWTVILVAVLAFGGKIGSQAALWWFFFSGTAGLILGLVMLRLVPKVREGRAAITDRHPTSESLAVGSFLGQGSSLAVAGTAGSVISDAAAGSLRGASTIMGPLNVLTNFVSISLTPTLVRRARNRRRDLLFCGVIGLIVMAAVFLWGVVILLLPDQWGIALLGDTWAGARSVVPWTVVEYLSLAMVTAATLGLKVRHEAGALLRQKVYAASATILMGCAAAFIWGDVVRVAMALALAAMTNAIVAWFQFIVLTRHPEPPA